MTSFRTVHITDRIKYDNFWRFLQFRIWIHVCLTKLHQQQNNIISLESPIDKTKLDMFCLHGSKLSM